MIVCPWCGKEYEPAGDRRCPHCGTVPPPGEERAAPEPEPPPEAPTSADFPGPASLLDFLLGPEGLGLPWERRSEFGFWLGLGLTQKAVLLSPLAAFL